MNFIATDGDKSKKFQKIPSAGGGTGIRKDAPDWSGMTGNMRPRMTRGGAMMSLLLSHIALI